MNPENLSRLIDAGYLKTALQNMPGASDLMLCLLLESKPIAKIKKEAIERIELHIKMNKK